MPSQKQSSQKQSKRGAASAPAPASPPSRRASPKVLLIALGAAVAAVIALVLALTLSSGHNSSSSTGVRPVGSLAGSLPGAADVQRLFAGLPQQGNALGSPNAPATMVEYIDLQCPYCREFETTVLPKLVSGYVRTGKLRIEQRLLAFIGPDSIRGRNAALAAGEQAKQFNFSELLYFNQGTENTGWLDQNMVNRAAASVPGLRVPQLLAAQGSAAVTAKADALDQEADTAGVNSTPTILVGRTGGTPEQVAMTSPGDTASVTAAIDQVLAG